MVRCAFRLYLYPHGYGMMWFLGLLGATGWPQKTVSWRREPNRRPLVPVVWDVVDSISCTKKCSLLFITSLLYGWICMLIIYTRYVFVFVVLWMCIQSLPQANMGLRVGTWCLMLLICPCNGGVLFFHVFPHSSRQGNWSVYFPESKCWMIAPLHRLKIAMKNSSCDYVTMLRIHGSNVLPN